LPRKASLVLTEAELRLMDVIWGKGPATVQQIQESLPESMPLAYNSVLTTIRILEKKKYLTHNKDGRAHVYRPLVARQEASRSEITHLLGRFFQNSRELLVLNLLQDEGLDDSELQRLRHLVQAKSDAANGKVRP
jgi:predicted transcriptional regulator